MSSISPLGITVGLVRHLVAGQFPEWADLPITPAEPQGHDNRTFRLGEELSVRLPSEASYVAAVSKEDRCLPLLAGRLGLPVPSPVATGLPTSEYPFPWSVRGWIPGDPASTATAFDRARFAEELGTFVWTLRAAPAQDGPLAGTHSFYRGCHPSVYGDQVQTALHALAGQVDVDACRAVWCEAVRSCWETTPVWFHGDIAADNLLVEAGRLSAVLDFGACGLGDPACDLVIAWTFLRGEEREAFREAVRLPEDAWARARGWALWKALITLAGGPSDERDLQASALEEILGRPAFPLSGKTSSQSR